MTTKLQAYATATLVDDVLKIIDADKRNDKITEMVKYHHKKMNDPNVSEEARATHELRMAAWIAARVS
jgi:hypothetical protein